MSTKAKAAQKAAVAKAKKQAAAAKKREQEDANKASREAFKITNNDTRKATQKYAMWLNYDNDRQTFVFPQLPEVIKTTTKGKVTSINIDNLGEVLHKGRTDALVISFDGIFPPEWGSYCACTEEQFVEPDDCVKWIRQLMAADNPAHFVLSGSPLGLNGYFVITSFTPREEGGDVGAIYYSIELKQYRSVTVKTVKISKKKSSSSKKKKKKKTTSGKKRVNNKAKTQTYTIRSGDCLWNIAKRFYGNGAKYTKIYKANKATLDKVAKKHGYRNCNGGNYVWPGTKIKIP